MLVTLMSACSKSSFQNNENISVSISADSSPDTKLILDPNDMSTIFWEETDKIYLWARKDGATDLALENKEFAVRELRHYNRVAIFSTTIPSMTLGKYRYFSTYPAPASSVGTVVTHKIASIQDGLYSGTKDILACNPIASNELSPAQTNFKQLDFKHLTHLLKITIPDGRNLFGQPIKSLIIKFPGAVVGDYVIDLADPFASAKLINESSNIRVDFATPVSDNSAEIWVYIAPTTIKGEIHFGAIGGNTDGTNVVSVNIDKTFEAGKVTPIKLTIPPKAEPKKINLKVLSNNLGEDITKVTATAPGNALFSNGKNVQAFELGADGYLSIQYYDELFLDEFKKGDIKLVYESKSVLLGGYSINLNDLTPDQKNNYFKEDLVFSYLLEQDFSEVLDKNNSESAKGSWLTDFGLSGWSGARWATSHKTSLNVRSRAERPQATWIIYASHGNVVTPPFVKLKDGVKVQLDVSFNYSGSLGGGASAMSFELGSTTNAIADDENTEIPNRAHIVNISPINGSPVNINLQGRYTIENATNKTRLMWVPKVKDPDYHFTKRQIFTGNLYIDNLKVSIKQ